MINSDLCNLRAKQRVPEQLKMLCDDATYWDQSHTFPPAEIAVRFHHRLVQIHPFINGNGRLSRLAADLFLHYRKHATLTWGGTINLVDANQERSEYIAALREADKRAYFDNSEILYLGIAPFLGIVTIKRATSFEKFDHHVADGIVDAMKARVERAIHQCKTRWAAS